MEGTRIPDTALCRALRRMQDRETKKLHNEGDIMEVKVARRHTKAPDLKLPAASRALYATFTRTHARTDTVHSGCVCEELISQRLFCSRCRWPNRILRNADLILFGCKHGSFNRTKTDTTSQTAAGRTARSVVSN